MTFQVLEEKKVKTRKTHICFLSGEEIPKGTIAYYQRILNDDQFYSVYCSLIADEFAKENKDNLVDHWDIGFKENCIRDQMAQEWAIYKKEREAK